MGAPTPYWDMRDCRWITHEEYFDAAMQGRFAEIQICHGGSFFGTVPQYKPASLRMQEGMIGGVSKKGTVG